jgi:2-keto-3-deoxy-L-fuconate dehydrogenase
MGDLDGRVAVVTGGGSGIGAATVRALRAGGARVGVLDVAPGDPQDDHVRAVACDVSDDDAVRSGVEAIVTGLGGIDILVNNAGISAVGPVDANDDAEWARVLDVNVIAVARVTRAALPHLRRGEQAAIVNVSSVAAWAGIPNRALYSASKGAVHALTLAMAADLVADGIRVNCVCPATVDTPWVARLLANAPDPAGEKQRLRARQPMGRLVTADEVAQAICYLAGPRSGATTGSALAVDGGMYGLRLPAR